MKKGQTNNPKGRPKNSPNKVTTELRQWISNLIDNNREQIEKDFMVLEPEKRIAVFEKFIQYVLPKQQQNVEIEKDNNFRETLERLFPKK